MKLKDIIYKIGKTLPYVGLYLSIQNFSMAVEAKKARLEIVSIENKRLMAEIESKQEYIIAKQASQNKIASLSTNAYEHLEAVKSHDRVIENLVERLNDPNITDIAAEGGIEGTLKHQTDLKIETIEKVNSNLKEIIDTIVSDKNSQPQLRWV